MSEGQITLRSFFPDGQTKDVFKPVIAAAGEAAKDHLPKAGKSAFIAVMGSALDQMLSLPLAGVLASPWTTIAEVSVALQETKHDPESTALVSLFNHGLTSAHRPKIDLVYGGKALWAMEMGLDLTMDLIGIALEVKGGKLHGVKAGHCQGIGLFTAFNTPLMKHDGRTLPLAGRVSFK